MPLVVYVLALCIFAQGTSELMLAGLLPGIAHDLHVSIPDAGMLISGFAIGMLVGGPVLAVVTLRWSKRRALLLFLALFVALHVVGALAPDYGVLFAARVASAFVYAGFWAVASAVAVGVVAPTAQARAMAVVAGGLSLATVLGLPGGTLIGQHLGWRAAFWTVAGLSALSMAVLARLVPADDGRPAAPPRLREEIRGLANRPLWLALATTAVSICAVITPFSYLAELLTGPYGIGNGWVPAVLALFGLGAFLGITVGGRTADRRPFTTLGVALVGVVGSTIGLALAGRQPAVAIVFVVLLGTFGFLTNPALNGRVFATAQGAPTLAAGVNVSAFNTGITVGPWLGGRTIDAGFGYTSTAWDGAILGAVALAAMALALADHRRRATTADPATDLTDRQDAPSELIVAGTTAETDLN